MAFECKNPYNSALQRGSRTFFPRYLAYGLVNRAAISCTEIPWRFYIP
jgi:hypothetical protein